MKERSKEDTDEMQNDCFLIQMINYKQVPFHKDPLLLRTRTNGGIHFIIPQDSSKNKMAKWNISPPCDLAEKPQ